MPRLFVLVVTLLLASAGVRAETPALKRGIDLSHWFSQSWDYKPQRLHTYFTDADAKLIRDAGCDHVRFTIDPAPLWDAAAGQFKAAHLALVDEAMDMLLAAGLNVVVDMQPSDQFKKTLREDPAAVASFEQFWSRFAAHLAGRDPNRIALELMNEPQGDDKTWPATQLRLLHAVRAAAPRHTIVVTADNWSKAEAISTMEPVDDANVLYTFHFYAPMDFTHQGATWGPEHWKGMHDVPWLYTRQNVDKMIDRITSPSSKKVLLWNSKENWDATKINGIFEGLAAWAKAHEARIYMGEFGVMRKFAAPADRAAWLRDVRSAAEKYGFGWAMWDYAGGFNFVNEVDGRRTPDPLVTEALGLKP